MADIKELKSSPPCIAIVRLRLDLPVCQLGIHFLRSRAKVMDPNGGTMCPSPISHPMLLVDGSQNFTDGI
jgi:hypothetical protein